MLTIHRRELMQREFPETPMNFIDIALKQSGYRLFSTYRVLEEAHRTYDPKRPAYNKIKFQRKIKSPDEFSDVNLDATIQHMSNNMSNREVEVLKELRAARRIRKKADAKHQGEIEANIEEALNLQKSIDEGTMAECGCCFGDFPLNRMIHCDNELLHFFCKACAKQTADTEVGKSKYELHCMSMDGCSGGFSLDQR
jgi:TRIAD3 protein (E3 ubiquitin-protein ligase RNF216)